MRNDNLAIKNFEIVKNNRKKLVNARKSSGGLAVCICKEIRSGIKILPFTNSEFIWIKLCKTFFNLNSDIYICGTYIASQGSSFNVRSDDLFTIIEQDIVSYSTKGMCMICGDLNGYTGTEPDFILDDNSNFLPLPYDYCSDTFLDRSNRDIRNPNLFGNKILELCKNTRLRIANDRFLGDCGGNFTCYNHMNSSSVIDYILLHEDLLKSVNSFCVELLNPLSIHCMIHVDIKLQYVKTEVNNNICLKPLPHKFHFDKISEEKFHNYMMSDIGSQK